MTKAPRSPLAPSIDPASAPCSCCQERIRELECLLQDARERLDSLRPGQRPAHSGDRASEPAGRLGECFPDLTDREREVLELYMSCVSDKIVARQLRTSIHTVRNQIASIEHKLGVHSREELVKKVLTSVMDPAW